MKKEKKGQEDDGFPVFSMQDLSEMEHTFSRKIEKDDPSKGLKLKETYQNNNTTPKPSLAILIIFFISTISFAQNSNHATSPTLENEAITGIKVGIIFIIGIGLISLLIYKILSTAKPPTQ